MTEKLTVTLHIRVSEETAAALKRLAEADRRKLAPFIGLVLDKYVSEHVKKGIDSGKLKPGGRRA